MHFIIVVIVSLFKSVAAYSDTIYLPDVPEDALEGYLQCKGNATQGLSGDMIWQGYLACLDAYFKNLGPNDLTDEEWSFFKNSRLGLDPPPTGKRTRREVRTLSDNEWNAVVVVWLTMYKEGTLRKFGRLHGQAATWAHMGAAFLVWHRVFITHFEEEMRKINPNVSLPYWDYTIDYKLTEPADSVVWTHCFFGQNDDESQIIKDGPFKDFYGAHGAYLSRAPGSSCRDRLINDKDVETVKNNCHYKDITLGSNNSNEPRILEVLHNHVHLWVGGDMSVIETAAFDPVFFVHHAFIDYIFEQFRKNQNERCNVIIGEDYPYDHCVECTNGNSNGHNPNDTMFAYSYLKNIDGLSLNWTTYYFDYEPVPSCPDHCKGKYMYCGDNNLCLTRTYNVCTLADRPDWKIALEEESALKPGLWLSLGTKFDSIQSEANTETLGLSMSEQADQQTYKDGLGIGFGVGIPVSAVITAAVASTGYFIYRKRQREHQTDQPISMQAS